MFDQHLEEVVLHCGNVCCLLECIPRIEEFHLGVDHLIDLVGRSRVQGAKMTLRGGFADRSLIETRTKGKILPNDPGDADVRYSFAV